MIFWPGIHEKRHHLVTSIKKSLSWMDSLLRNSVMETDSIKFYHTNIFLYIFLQLILQLSLWCRIWRIQYFTKNRRYCDDSKVRKKTENKLRKCIQGIAGEKRRSVRRLFVSPVCKLHFGGVKVHLLNKFN